MTDLVAALKAIAGPGGWTDDPVALEPHLVDWRRAFHGRTPLMVSPRSTDEVAAVVKACREARTGIVPQGGNTGMCAAAVPDDSGTQILLSMARMNRIRALDAANYSMDVDAGCVLATIQSAARDAGLYFPLSLGAEGSCQIGGNLATNAGGLNVIRYGTARQLVLGLEVVLADGSVIHGLRGLRKDAAGYDLKQLFIGSEGTLGIITAATLRLCADPGVRETALVGLAHSEDAVRLLDALRQEVGDRIEAFELVADRVFGLVEQHIPGARLPFAMRHPWYVLVETAAPAADAALQAALIDAAESGIVTDAVIAKHSAEADALWRLRHSIAEAERKDGRALKHDVSVPLSAMTNFLRTGEALVAKLAPEARLVVFGHVGDGNLHYNVVLPRNLDESEWLRLGESVTGALYELVASLGGSFSAEHGIGMLKKRYLATYRPDPEYALMRRLKEALDPDNILNPGKIF